MTDNELGVFLRLRRAALSPADVGLPAGERRRTAGLRRAEVATLSGVSVEYLTRLEQGRDRRPSVQVVNSLSGALRLSMAERAHLYRLTKTADGAFSCVAQSDTPSRDVRAGVRATLDRLGPGPAVLLNRLGEVLAYTEGYGRLMGEAGVLAGDPPSLPRFVFGSPRARTVFPDWDEVADEQVAALKQGPFRNDPDGAALADELERLAGDAFTKRAETLTGLPRAHGVLRMVHPLMGPLRLRYETLDLSEDDRQRIVVYLPEDAPAEDALAALLS
ncbi:helix-turn-helix transcriptional regulator [Catenuloplanes japonicus]|uniref:helix-turn-helix transcriptional regulator n=1 Tax=Catenuloplanes japonicus TaxID=33876 RepID=UPI000526A1FE|nr:helix-turn-helix transcriptional regulator [Catenuloplanes japonicus]